MLIKKKGCLNDVDLTVDKEEAVRAAKAHGSGDSDLFSTALGFLGQTKASTYGCD